MEDRAHGLPITRTSRGNQAGLAAQPPSFELHNPTREEFQAHCVHEIWATAALLPLANGGLAYADTLSDFLLTEVGAFTPAKQRLAA